MSGTDLAFYIFSALAVAFSFLVVANRNPINSAFSLVMVFFCVAANYVLLHAHLIATLQILVYAGAIMVLFIFVIMLLNADVKTAADVKSAPVSRSVPLQVTSVLLMVCLFLFFVRTFRHGTISGAKNDFTPEKIESLGGNTQVLSEVLFSDFILPFEITSILLLVAIVGSVAIAKRKLEMDVKK